MIPPSELASLFREALVEWWNDNTFRLSASLAFYTIFSIAPVLLISVALSGLVFGHETAMNQIVVEVERLVGPQGGQAVRDVLDATGGFGGSLVATIVGIVTLLVGSTVVFAELQSALNTIWDVESRSGSGFVSSLVRVRLRSFALAVTAGFLLLVSLVVSALLSGLRDWIAGPGAGWLWQTAHALVSFFVVAILFAMVYRYLPDARIQWSDVLVGSAVTAALFAVGKYLIGLYLGQFAVGNTYGAAGSFAVLLIWIYYSALISFYGAEFTQVYARRYGTGIRPEKHAIRIGRKPDDPRRGPPQKLRAGEE